MFLAFGDKFTQSSLHLPVKKILFTNSCMTESLSFALWQFFQFKFLISATIKISNHSSLKEFNLFFDSIENFKNQ